jgi:serine/threonine protein kinase/tetratricopeptide (TPR) repeat protein
MATIRLSVDQIFDEAMRRTPGQDRVAYLDAACNGDADLRERVERLLQAFAEAGSFLESPAADLTPTAPANIAERPGMVIGPYKLLQQLGEGGFGVVFLAEQERPVRRKVALKIIKPGMDTRQVIARFEAERQALAMMDHPNISKVYDAGATENGRPYFVMELVQGVPITEYCDQSNLTTRQRLEPFITVCQAVQHAHQKGVIHRDIKPTNVLVTIQDGQPTPKIIDFGVAKAIGQQLTEHTLVTAYAQMVGTPLYMSPEQAELSPLGVDTRSDIYSLGVLLYELLTGTTPFDKDRLHAASYDELRRIIREEEPPRPSTRISTLAGDLATTVAEHRRTDARRLRQQVRGELDWIVMKCLEKDRNRRYDTASGLTRDVERYLHDEPVQACPPSAAYHFRKFARRNKVALAIASAAIAVLFFGVVGLALSNRLIAAQRLRAEQNFVRSRTAVSKTLANAAYGIGDWSQLSPALRKKFAEEAIRFYESFLQEESTDPALQFETAVAFRSLSQLYRSIDEMQQSEQFIHKAIALLEGLTSKFPDVAKYRQQLGYSHYALGLLLKKTKRPLEAEVAHKKAIDLYEDLIAQGPDESDYYIELAPIYPVLATLQKSRGASQEAERTIQRLLGFLSNAPVESFDAAVMARLLLSDSPTGAQKQEAHRQLRRAFEEYSQVAVDYPNDLDRRLKAADGFVAFAKLGALNRDFAATIDEAHQWFIAALQGLLSRFPDSRHCQEQVAHKFRLWAVELEQNSRHLSQAEHAHREAIGLFEQLGRTDPNAPQFQFYLADSSVHLGDVQRRSGRPEDAEPLYRRALEIYDRHAAEITKDSASNALQMTQNYFRLAGLLGGRNRPSDAQRVRAHRFIQRVIDEYGRFAERYPGDLDRRVNALNGYVRTIGDCAAAKGFEGEVDEINRWLEAELPKLVADFPDSKVCQWYAASLYRNWAVQLLPYSSYLSQAERALRESIKFHEKVTQSDPKRPGAWLYLADRNIVLGYVNWLTGRPKDAETAYCRAVEIYNQHEAEEIAADTTSSVHSTINIDSVWLAYYLGCIHREDEAAKFIRKAVLSARRVTEPIPSALAFYQTALVQIRFGDNAGYQESCKALVDLSLASADDSTKARTILTWCHAPDAIEDLSLTVKRAEELAAHNSIDSPHIIPYIVGAAHYRAGHYERAALEFEKSIATYPTDSHIGDRIINWQRLFLAMTKWQLSQQDEARQLLAEIQPAIDAELHSLSTPFNYRLTLEVLRREAETMIEPVSPSSPAP